LLNEAVWLSRRTIERINREAVGATGERHFLRDAALLESAIAKPRNQFLYGGVTDISTLAICLLAGITQNHPFEQGNKRTAFLALELFLNRNGYYLAAVDSDDLAERIIALSVRKISERDLIEFLDPYVLPSDLDET
jgi:death-on-curing protein